MTSHKDKIKITLISTLLWRIASHGKGLFNKYSFHDDAGMFNVVTTYETKARYKIFTRPYSGLINFIVFIYLATILYYASFLLYTTTAHAAANPATTTIVAIGAISPVFVSLFTEPPVVPAPSVSVLVLRFSLY